MLKKFDLANWAITKRERELFLLQKSLEIIAPCYNHSSTGKMELESQHGCEYTACTKSNAFNSLSHQ